jgi:NAD(P)-dependent dehydrogenase (short-subunit alcohol dehydrogenase family)
MNKSDSEKNVDGPNNSRVVVVGASSGIGAAIADALLEDGHQVWMCARRTDLLEQIAGGRENASTHRCDVSVESDVVDFAASVFDETSYADVVINCAASPGPIGPSIETSTADWEATLRTNVLGPLFLARHFVPLLGGGTEPTILNFAGGGAFNPVPNFGAYAVSKSALVRLVETLAVELADHGITCNAIAPGFVATEIHQATLSAGPELAGVDMYERAREALNAGEGVVPISWPVAYVRHRIEHRGDGLTGKTISVSFDPWGSPEFESNIPEINASSLYSMERINLRHLSDGNLKSMLEAARKGSSE